MRALAGILILAPLVLGGATTNPTRGDVGAAAETCPFPFDPNLVEGKLLGWLVAEVGQPIRHTRTWSDPDGDPAMVEIVKGPEELLLLNQPKAASYTIRWIPQRPQTAAIVLRITDRPAAGEPQSAVGTLLIHVLPRPRTAAARSPCGGRPQ